MPRAARPRPRVPGVFHRESRLAQVERSERVDHDGELVEEVDADRALDGAGLRAMREPAGVQGDRALLDARAATRLVVAARVEQHLVRVDVVMVVRDRDRPRVVVDLPRHERADDEVRSLERLMYRRRLVHATGDRLELVDGEGPRVQAAVPADDVERVIGVRELGPSGAGWAAAARAVLYVHIDVGSVDKHRLGGASDVALAVWRVLKELPAHRQVALRRSDVAGRLDDEGTQRNVAGRHDAVDHRRWDDDVVALADIERAE